MRQRTGWPWLPHLSYLVRLHLVHLRRSSSPSSTASSTTRCGGRGRSARDVPHHQNTPAEGTAAPSTATPSAAVKRAVNPSLWLTLAALRVVGLAGGGPAEGGLLPLQGGAGAGARMHATHTPPHHASSAAAHHDMRRWQLAGGAWWLGPCALASHVAALGLTCPGMGLPCTQSSQCSPPRSCGTMLMVGMIEEDCIDWIGWCMAQRHRVHGATPVTKCSIMGMGMCVCMCVHVRSAGWGHGEPAKCK